MSTAADVQELTGRIHRALEHGDHDNALWFIRHRDSVFNALPVIERLAYLAWAKARVDSRPGVGDAFCIPNLETTIERVILRSLALIGEHGGST